MNLLEICAEFQHGLESLLREQKNSSNPIWNAYLDYPLGSCSDVSELLCLFLREHWGFDVNRLKIVAGAKNQVLGTHVWNRIDDYIVDLTAHQFEKKVS